MLAEFSEDRGRFVLPFLKENSTEMIAWADMLSMIGQKNIRLHDRLAKAPAQYRAGHRSSGRTIIRELERERSRIARELHAGAGQPLAGIKLNLELLRDNAGALPQAGLDALTRLQALAEQALEQIRSVSHKLHPPEWQGLSTGDAIRGLLRSSGLDLHLSLDVDIRELPVEPSQAVKIALYRCTQECISNVLRHSGATRFALSLRECGPMLELRLEDNGRGFPKDSPGGKGIGLLAIREHSEALGGACEISSGADGVRIRVKLPLATD